MGMSSQSGLLGVLLGWLGRSIVPMQSGIQPPPPPPLPLSNPAVVERYQAATTIPAAANSMAQVRQTRQTLNQTVCWCAAAPARASTGSTDTALRLQP
jgi:hypothetical protein